MIWYKDADSRILRYNRAAAQWIGKIVEEIEGSTFLVTLPGGIAMP